jgi:hypothetical protein
MGDRDARLDQAIRECAYHLWMENGCEEGNADAHWLAAQREVLIASFADVGRGAMTEVPETVAK